MGTMNSEPKISLRRATYPFRLRDPVSGIWVRARFLAKLPEIADCLAAWEIMAPPVLATKRG
jgi:hypothetical protein